MDQQIWQWTLTKEAVAPCFVRDVLNMRQHKDRAVDFFWLGHVPCRTVLLSGMVVAIQVYDKRSIYTIDDGTAVIDCVLRHPRTLPAQPHNLPLPTVCSTKLVSPKKAHLDKAKLYTLESAKPPPQITEPGYPVRVVGKVARHYESKQIHADTIDPCPSSLDEITHFERVIELHKTKYSLAVPFVPPTSRAIVQTGKDADASVFSGASYPGPSPSYTLPAPPPAPLSLQNQNRPPSIPTRAQSTYQHSHVPSSPIASSVASSTPSSPCKPSNPVKVYEPPRNPKLRHPSRLHTRDLTANTFRLYVKHYMDNAPPAFLISCPSPSRSMCGGPTTPTKRARDEVEDEPTPRPRVRTKSGETWAAENVTDNEDEDASRLGFTISHLRRVPELALLAARVVRSEARRRDKADREKERGSSSISASLARPNRSGEMNKSIPKTGTSAALDSPREKMKRLFSWAVVKMYEEGSIILWDGDVRPLPVPPPPLFGEGESRDRNELWSRRDNSTSTDLSHSCSLSVSVLYTSSASASLYSHYHAPRQSPGSKPNQRGFECDVVDTDTNPAYLSDPLADEEAYIPLTPRFLAVYVRDALGAIRHGRHGNVNGGGEGAGRARREPTPGDILAYMQRTDTRWARLGVWVVEEALTLLRAG